jgi:hypothetical protein
MGQSFEDLTRVVVDRMSIDPAFYLACKADPELALEEYSADPEVRRKVSLVLEAADLDRFARTWERKGSGGRIRT